MVMIVLGCAVGCSLQPGSRRTAAVAPDSPNAVVAPAVQLLGTVHVIGSGGRFVLVEARVASLVAGLTDGEALVCRAAGNVSANLRVSRERRPPFVVADVADGTPNLGDEVFIEPASNHAPPPPATATLPPAPDFHANPALPTGR